MSSAASCLACGCEDWEVVLELPPLPVLVNAQVTPDVAPDVPRGSIDLAVCHRCGHLFNSRFDPELLAYDASYENSLHFSPLFRQFAEELRDRLVRDHDLVGQPVAELGSGPGHFLAMLCEGGASAGVGFDPSYEPDRLAAPVHPDVRLSTELYPDDGSLQVRMAFSQHVLEHLTDPVQALVALRRSVTGGGVVYTEVPNGDLMMRECALWDLIYEHASYFVPSSLTTTCTRAGLRVTRLGDAFDGQFLWCEAVPAGTDDQQLDAAAPDVERARSFGRAAAERIDAARDDVARETAQGSVALWGAGSKGMTFLNLVAGAGRIDAVVDVNPRKHGWGVPGTSLAISAPESLVDVDPTVVLLANPAYTAEVTAQLDALGLAPRVVPLWG